MDTNPNQQIVINAWNMLWNKQKHPDYYLPDVILNGIKANGITVDPLGNLDIPKYGPFTLFQESGLGSISIEFSNNIIQGLNTMSNDGINVPADGSAFSATVKISALASSGKFDVLATGLSMCAVDSVWALGSLTGKKALSAADIDDSPGIIQAKDYRTKLLNQGENGQFLVSTYYDNNNVYNDIANDPSTIFNYNWAYYQTNGKGPDGTTQVTVTSKILSSETTVAAQNPDSNNQVVGYEAYNLHSYIGQGLMIKSIDHKISDLQNQYSGQTIPASVQAQIDKLQQAKEATFVFGENTKPINQGNANGITVNTAMNNVQNNAPITTSEMTSKHKTGMSLAKAASNDDYPLYTDAMIRVDEMEQEFLQLKAANKLSRNLKDSTPVSGTYSLTIPVPTVTFNGKIITSESAISVQITSITAVIPPLMYNLKPSDSGSSLVTKIMEHYASATYIHQLAQQKTNEALNSTQLLGYMTDRINQALNKVFG
ncbi:hypothetical protein [Chryseobacterium sp. c4a]|uniref:hypothetical protein n=1 Tax=Chryseobacterium sp. c4a TaxID=1573582 RepID=UPI00135BA4B6|nr:hypothetical protein [Chryseobacterium sp. c4a]